MIRFIDSEVNISLEIHGMVLETNYGAELEKQEQFESRDSLTRISR